MIFTSDNWAGAHPAISEALTRHATGFSAAYGTGDLDRQVEATFNEIFEREVAVFFVATGTAANSIGLASVSRPGGVAFCHHQAHVIEDECGAPEFFSDARLSPVDGANGKMDPEALRRTIARYPADFVHHGQPVAVTLTQATEIGTVYSHDEIEAISAVAREKNLPLHMDGARFANAMVALSSTPAQMTVDRGVDIVSFGGTKNGCWCAEALVFFDPEMARQVPFIRKRGAHLFSKSRFIAAQFAAYLENGLWLELAAHSNAMADRLRSAIRASAKARLAWDGRANEVFAVLPKTVSLAAETKGARFYEWPAPKDMTGAPAPDEVLIRLVTSFATSETDVDRFAELLG
ncbi:MAG: low specificity L-threonine aldolase [Rhizobiales bacterium]|nr:low specificity L-threonine aldolase [Hyphomicrobiales bacterium]|tara:strand:- start:255 stop:1301 length:1047 start_codon:yes stop_codon:yes gene_type:complete